ncbi:MAG: GNAT family N-acetyltransferase [Bacillus sp. (in: firmicutes)]
MHWYDKLNDYFPIEEMKSQEHLEALLKDFPDTYHKDEGKYHVLMYVELDDFIFIDYLYVSSEARGKGIGHTLLQRLKEKGKPILLEVEPVDYKDTDTHKRLKFYQREEFQHAKTIGYRRRSLATNQVTKMEILYWAPNHEGEDMVYDALVKTYKKIHTYKDKQFYGQSYEPVEDVVRENNHDEIKDIFDEI